MQQRSVQTSTDAHIHAVPDLSYSCSFQCCICIKSENPVGAGVSEEGSLFDGDATYFGEIIKYLTRLN